MTCYAGAGVGPESCGAWYDIVPGLLPFCTDLYAIIEVVIGDLRHGELIHIPGEEMLEGRCEGGICGEGEREVEWVPPIAVSLQCRGRRPLRG